MENFYINKQIVYKKEIAEDNTEDKVEDLFKVHKTGRAVTFPFIKESLDEKQRIQEKIDYFWALKAAKSTRDEIRMELIRILEKELGLERKRINDQMHDFKDFEIKKALVDRERSLIQIKMLDAISGPNNEGFQMELQHKLCFEIAKGIGKNTLAIYFLRRVEQIFILEYEEEEKESNFKE